MLKTLDQSLNILMSFTKENPSWGGRELAHHLNLNHTNLYRILSTFEKNGFLVKDPDTKRYSLGIRIWELGLTMYESLNISSLIRPILEKLKDQTGESIFLTGFDGLEGLTLDALEPDDKVKYSVSIGSRAPLYVGASYRSILAFLPETCFEQVVANGLKAYTSTTITDPAKLRADLESIVEKGWARSTGEYTKDVIAVAVPLFSHGTKIVGSLTVSGPIYRMTDDVEVQSLELLKQASMEIMEIIDKYELNFNRYLKFS